MYYDEKYHQILTEVYLLIISNV